MSYDNERSVGLKAEFAYDAGLAGVTITGWIFLLMFNATLTYSLFQS